MNPRHVRPKGQPRRTWAPLGEITYMLPVLTETLPVLTGKQTAALLDQMDGDLFREVRRGPLPLGTAARTTAEVLEHLAPRRTPARTVARGIRRPVGHAVFAVCVLVAIAVPPVLHAVGV